MGLNCNVSTESSTLFDDKLNVSSRHALKREIRLGEATNSSNCAASIDLQESFCKSLGNDSFLVFKGAPAVNAEAYISCNGICDNKLPSFSPVAFP